MPWRHRAAADETDKGPVDTVSAVAQGPGEEGGSAGTAAIDGGDGGDGDGDGDVGGRASSEVAARQRALLGDALEARTGDILAACKCRYEQATGIAAWDSGMVAGWDVTELAVHAIAHWLRTGESAGRSEREYIDSLGTQAVREQDHTATRNVHAATGVGAVTGASAGSVPAGEAQSQSSARPDGKASPERGPRTDAPAGEDRHVGGRLSVTLLTKLNLWWRDTTCAVMAEEAERLGIVPAVLLEAQTVVWASCDSALVGMAKRYDDQLTELNGRLHYLASHDPLTNLVNRSVLTERLERALAHLGNSSNRLAVMFVDLDNFKAINDVLGHHTGDLLLCAVADRLLEQIRPGDLVSRFGGDEFVVLFERIGPTAAQANLLANRLHQAISAPIDIDGQVLYPTASMGVAVASKAGRSADEVLARADQAMYQAKRAGRNRVAVVDADDALAPIRFVVASDLRRALRESELRLAYQPLCRPLGHEVVGFEALLRWDHPEHGAIPPLDFIPAAEESGLMDAIGGWVMDEACRQAIQWGASLGSVPQISVNVSGRQLEDPGFAQKVAHVLADTGMPPGALVLEITESVLLGDPSARRGLDRRDDFASVLGEVRALGVRLSIDDFGTGYSSLAYLRRFPVDQLKVDRSFVEDVGMHGDTRIMEAVIRLAHDLGMEVVAEGIETDAELAIVRSLGCDVVQGFLLGRPVAPSVLEQSWEPVGLGS